MFSVRASLKNASCLNQYKLTYCFNLQVVSKTWPLPGHVFIAIL